MQFVGKNTKPKVALRDTKLPSTAKAKVESNKCHLLQAPLLGHSQESLSESEKHKGLLS